MAFKIGDIENLLSELTCTKCKKLLSVFPIYASLSIGNVCGRCTESIESMISNKNIERHTLYESLAKYVLFPCSNKDLGCDANLKHDEVLNHENCCSFRLRMCPFNMSGSDDSVLQCNWKGTIMNLNDHLDLSHGSKEKNNPLTFYILNMEKSYVKVNFVKVESPTFIIVRRYDVATNKFYCLVMCCDEEESCKDYTYQFELGKGDFRVTHHKSSLEVLMETSEALKKVDNMIVIDISGAVTMFSELDSNFKCIISITKKSNDIAPTNSKPITLLSKELPNPSDVKQKLLESNKLILKELQCPVCNNYMKSPIYICSKGHSFCNKCKSKISECPICCDKSINGCSLTLEKLAEKVLYPCKYSFDGCTEFLHLSDIKRHQITCIWRTDCPLIRFPISCKVKERISNPISHVLKTHSQYVFNQYEVCKIKHVSSKVKYNVTIIENDVFIICQKYYSSQDEFKFNFLHLGYQSDIPMYRYILEFANDGKFELQLTVKMACQRVPVFIESCLSSSAKCLTIPRNMLEPYLTWYDDDNCEELSFKFKIEKI